MMCSWRGVRDIRRAAELCVICSRCMLFVVDLLFKCHVRVECDSKYFYIIVVLYSVGAYLYGHLVLYVEFYREDDKFHLIFINRQRTSAHPVLYICNAV